MATLKDIAAKTGLSINTVSRAIRNEGYVSRRAADLVAQAVSELGYQPNRAAQALRLKNSREVVVIAESYDYLHIERISGVCDYMSGMGYKALVHFTHRCDKIIDEVIKFNPAGIIVISSSNESVNKVAELRAKIPCVIAGVHPLENVDCVCVDRFSGVYNAVQYLYRNGRRRIMFGETYGSGNRKDGYLRAVHDLGLPALMFEATSANHEIIRQQGIAAARNISEMSELPDAVQTSDYLACGLLTEFIRLGIRVPDDIAVVGFDDREIAEMTDPPLTTLSHPGEEVGAACAKLIIDRIERGLYADAIPQCVKIPMKLIIRQST